MIWRMEQSRECGFVFVARVNTLNSLCFLNENPKLYILSFSRPFYCCVEVMKVALNDWIRKSKSNSTIDEPQRHEWMAKRSHFET